MIRIQIIKFQEILRNSSFEIFCSKKVRKQMVGHNRLIYEPDSETALPCN